MTDTLSAEPALYPPRVVPPPKPLPLARFLLRFIDNPLRALPQQIYEQPLVVYRPGPSGMVWVTDPTLIERILLHEHESFAKTPLERRIFAHTLGDGILTSEGASWRWQRRTAAPLFRHAELLGYVPAMVEAAEAQLERWRASRVGIQAIDRDMTTTTFDVISQTMFSGDALADGPAIQRAGGQFLEKITWELAAGLLRLPGWVWHPGKAPMRRAARELRTRVEAMLQRRRAAGRNSDDLLGRLMRVRDPDTGTPMSDKQLIDNLLTFLTAGHETTAKALTWTLYLLARAPAWQTRVREEVLRVAAQSRIAPEHIDHLTATRQVLKEAMRLYPPAPVLTRIVTRDIELGGVRLESGTLIIMSVFAVHRHRQHWHDPDRFDPERFAPSQESKLLRAQFIPFGFGPRTCIGMSFALLEATVILATLVRAARFDWDGRHLPEPVSRVTLRPKGGMPLAVTLLS